MDYLGVESAVQLDAALDTIANKADGPTMVFVDHEVTNPATQVRILVGHPTRSSLRWTRFGSPVLRCVAVDESLSPWEGMLACDVEGAVEEVPPDHSRLAPATARRAVLEFVASGGCLPRGVPLWTDIANGQPVEG